MIQKYLSEGEEVLFDSMPSKKYRHFVFMRDLFVLLVFIFIVYNSSVTLSETLGDPVSGLSIIFTAVFSFVGLLYLCFHQLSFYFTRYVVTNRHVMIRKGIIRINFKTVNLNQIQDTQVKRTLFDRILLMGKLYIFTANDSNPQPGETNPLNKVPKFDNVDDPDKVRKILVDAINERKED